jgi:hypothetical protein
MVSSRTLGTLLRQRLSNRGAVPNPPLDLDIFVKSDGLGIFLVTGKVSDARRRGATSEAYEQYAAMRSERRQHSR